MKFNVVYYYRKNFLPSKRYRKIRECEDSGVVTVEIPEVKAIDFPVAFVVRKYESVYEKAASYKNFEDMDGDFRLFDETIRTHNGKLYSLYRVTHGAAISLIPESQKTIQMDLEFPVRSRFYPNDNNLFSSISLVLSDNSLEQEEKVKKTAEKYLYFDGCFWKECTEPRYVVNTFGLGHNHGGTDLSITDEYNSNISKERYFSALHKKDAIEYGVATALARGDTDYVSRIRNTEENIEVFMPELVTVEPQTQHGDGCDFMNRTEALIRASSSSGEAGILCMVQAFKK